MNGAPAPLEVERETLEVDVLFVGGGPASLAGAIRLKQLVNAHNEAVEKGQKQGEKLEPVVMVLEKGRAFGSLGISGAVMDPRALNELLPNHLDEGFPLESRVESDDMAYLTARGMWKLPFVPPFLQNHGYYICSLSKVVKWMAAQAEAMGIDCYSEFPAAQPLMEGDRLAGVQTGDKGIGADGRPRANFEPGMNIRAKVTILGEGPRGTLTKVLVNMLELARGRNPQVYSIGVKEVWEVRPEKHRKGHVLHTFGHPLPNEVFGGAFLYHMDNHMVSLGLVIGLDYADPYLDPQVMLQRLKRHPRVASVLEGGKLVQYGAKAIPEGGWFSLPRYWGDGFMLIGDSAGFLDSRRLKGIHLAMKSGMLAAETAFESLLKNDFSADALKTYEDKVEASWIKKELWPVRNFHQCFQGGMIRGMLRSTLHMLFGGRGLHVRMEAKIDSAHYGRASGFDPSNARDKFDDRLTFDKLKDVYFSGTSHNEHQPPHLHVHNTEVCVTQCAQDFGNPCERFCPANVYEIVADEGAKHGRRLQINFSNCVHCKTCDIKDPYQIITWTTPEGGGGPQWTVL
jgi:electron-transferring-flavoprotein dehydrogenase